MVHTDIIGDKVAEDLESDLAEITPPYVSSEIDNSKKYTEFPSPLTSHRPTPLLYAI